MTRSLIAIFTEHVNDMVYSVEKLNSLVSAARVDLEAFKAREYHHRRSKTSATRLSNLHVVVSGVRRISIQFIEQTLTIAFHARNSVFITTAADKNRRRVTFWALVECFLILAVAGVQIMRIRNFFEYKRMV